MKFYLFIRRIIDTIIALIAMIILSPVLLAVAIAVCVDSKGGAIFKQKRIGLNGKPYNMYKFRSMVTNAQNMGTGVYSFEGDPRITMVGNFKRKTYHQGNFSFITERHKNHLLFHLDELNNFLL